VPLPRVDVLVACVGLTDIQWENGLAEISLIVDPERAKCGHGAAAVKLVLAEAFDRLRLETVFGEVYSCNPATDFWIKVTEPYGAVAVRLPRRKFWNGQLFDSLYFSIAREDWEKHGRDTHSDTLPPA
ncbi:MAG TPA: GNAT family protein, partial [Vicinamibacterales bacterium]|nr:GNAT family protein [Vicinamibacterales bacterium]